MAEVIKSLTKLLSGLSAILILIKSRWFVGKLVTRNLHERFIVTL